MLEFPNRWEEETHDWTGNHQMKGKQGEQTTSQAEVHTGGACPLAIYHSQQRGERQDDPSVRM